MSPTELQQKLSAVDITNVEVLHITVTDIREVDFNFFKKVKVKELQIDFANDDIVLNNKAFTNQLLADQLNYLVPDLRKVSY